MTDNDISILIKADDKASAQIREVDAKLDNLTGTTNKSGLGFLSMSTAVMAGQAAFTLASRAIGEMTGFLSGCIEESIAGEDALKQTEAVIRSTGGAAGMTAEAIQNIASSLQSETTFADDAIQSAENLLLTFTNIGKDIFPEATEVVLNMSQALGQDLKSSSIQLGKALQDPILGISALRKVGVNFSDDQKEVVKQLVETGQTAKAQKLILKELNVEFGGSAQDAAETFSGKMKVLGHQFDDFKESVGGALLKAVEPFVSKLSAWAKTDQAQQLIKDITKRTGELIEGMLKWITEVAIPWVTIHWPQIKKVLHETITIIKDVTKWVKEHKDVVYIMVAAWVAFKTTVTVMNIYGVLSGMIQWLMGAVAATGSLTGAIGILNAALLPGLAVAAAVASLAYLATKIRDCIRDFKDLDTQRAKLDKAQDVSVGYNTKLAQYKAGKITKADLDAYYQQNVMGHYASGTNFVPETGMYEVGENGPERVILPRGSKVIPNNKINNTNNTKTITIGTVVLGSAEAARQFFTDLDNDSILASKGMTTNRGRA